MKHDYVENYIHGLYNLNVFPIQEILHTYDKVLVTTTMSLDQAKKYRESMERIEWTLLGPSKFLSDPTEMVWSYSTGVVQLRNCFNA